MNLNIITDNAVLNANIKKIDKQRQSLHDLIQATGMGALWQALKHKNINTANMLVQAVGKGMKQQALVLWLCEFGPMNPAGEKQQKDGTFVLFDKTKMPADEGEMNERLLKAAAKEWSAENTEKNAATFYLANGIHALISQFEKAEQGKGTKQYVANEHDAEVIKQLRAIAERMPKRDFKAEAANVGG
ncbi:hypothetical protein [Stenotrophomonas phage vB_SmaS_P15]|uniref:Uncharacterized protein n=1 Tax=Stenotrophomonas phage vB_SmaS_P15 TaxID=2894592 RepID=A0AAE9C6R3_9CAUD|nr:hypothetical protein [Stenotrophomonas phage vB_SmaS_P15]